MADSGGVSDLDDEILGVLNTDVPNFAKKKRTNKNECHQHKC